MTRRYQADRIGARTRWESFTDDEIRLIHNSLRDVWRGDQTNTDVANLCAELANELDTDEVRLVPMSARQRDALNTLHGYAGQFAEDRGIQRDLWDLWDAWWDSE